MPLVSDPITAAVTANGTPEPSNAVVVQVPQLTRLQRKPSFVEKSSTVGSMKAPHLQPVALQPERCSTAIAPLAFLADIERIEINETRECDGVTYYVLDVFLHHFNTRLPANLNYLRQACASSSSSSSSSPVSSSSPSNGSAKPDYQVERRFSDFCELRSQVYEVASLNPQYQCKYCHAFIVYVRFETQQPRTLTKFTTISTTKRKRMLAGFLNDFVGMAQCRHLQNRKCESHDFVPQLIEYFVRDHHEKLSESGSSSPVPQPQLSWLS